MNTKKQLKMTVIVFLLCAALFMTSCGSSFLSHNELQFTGENGITIPGDMYPQDNIQMVVKQPPDQSLLTLGFIAALSFIILSLATLTRKLLPG